jgi:uncharacterized Rmd1/YagE family protein
VPKLKQQLARSRVTEARADDAADDDPAKSPDALRASPGRPRTISGGKAISKTVTSKKVSRWKKIERVMEQEGADELYGASRINAYATSERYDLNVLTARLRSLKGTWTEPEALDDETVSARLLEKSGASLDDDDRRAEFREDGFSCCTTSDTKIAFFFEYGIVVFWGLTREEEFRATRDLLESCEIEPFGMDEVEVDTMFFAYADPEDPKEKTRFRRPSPSPSFRKKLEADESIAFALSSRASTTSLDGVDATGYSTDETFEPSSSSDGFGFDETRTLSRSEREFATVVDDVVAIPPSQAGDAAVMLAASHALAQSTKLALFEQRAAGLADVTESIPKQMARDGETGLTTREATKLRGEVFLRRAELNVASEVLDSPAFFWSAPDRYARLYEEMREYLEVETRAEVLNTRLGVLEDLVSAAVSNLETENGTRLELIVIWLVAVEVVIGLVEIWGIVGLGREP